MNKKPHFSIAVILAILITPALATAQTVTDRDYIASKFRVYYVPQPNAATPLYYTIPISSIVANDIIFSTASNDSMNNSLRILRQLFRPLSAGGNRWLQRHTANVLRISNKIVLMVLYNDVGTSVTAAAEARLNVCISGTARSVWPCAFFDRDANGIPNADTAGIIKMGEQYFIDNGLSAGRTTFIHELMHTQDPSDRREHIWFSTRLRRSFSYGSDNIHYFTELTPNITATYKEGIANSFTYLYNTTEKNEALAWFAENGDCVVETARPAHIEASQWLYSEISSRTPPGRGRAPSAAAYNANIVRNYRVYRIAELSARHILHNEKIMGIIAAQFAEKFGYTKFISAIRHTNAAVTAVSTSPLAQLINQFCIEALPAGVEIRDIIGVSRADESFLYPLALVDYFTYYRTRSQAEFRQLFENLIPETWVELYWVNGKDAVRGAAPFTMTNGQPSGTQNITQHLSAIAAALGMH